MKRLIIWLAKKFNVNLVTEKIIYKDRIVEKIVEVPVEGIKEVEVEVIKEVYIEVPTEKIIELTYKYDGDLIVKGNLVVTGYLKVDGEITCFKINNSLKNK